MSLLEYLPASEPWYSQLLLWPFSLVLKASRPLKKFAHDGTTPGKLSRLENLLGPPMPDGVRGARSVAQARQLRRLIGSLNWLPRHNCARPGFVVTRTVFDEDELRRV